MICGSANLGISLVFPKYAMSLTLVHRYFIPADEIPAGNLVLIRGVDASISKTATLAGLDIDEDNLYIFRPIKHMTQSVLQVAIEPIPPSELPKMLAGVPRNN